MGKTKYKCQYCGKEIPPDQFESGSLSICKSCAPDFELDMALMDLENAVHDIREKLSKKETTKQALLDLTKSHSDLLIKIIRLVVK